MKNDAIAIFVGETFMHIVKMNHRNRFFGISRYFYF